MGLVRIGGREDGGATGCCGDGWLDGCAPPVPGLSNGLADVDLMTSPATELAPALLSEALRSAAGAAGVVPPPALLSE